MYGPVGVMEADVDLLVCAGTEQVRKAIAMGVARETSAIGGTAMVRPGIMLEMKKGLHAGTWRVLLGKRPILDCTCVSPRVFKALEVLSVIEGSPAGCVPFSFVKMGYHLELGRPNVFRARLDSKCVPRYGLIFDRMTAVARSWSARSGPLAALARKEAPRTKAPPSAGPSGGGDPALPARLALEALDE